MVAGQLTPMQTVFRVSDVELASTRSQPCEFDSQSQFVVRVF